MSLRPQAQLSTKHKEKKLYTTLAAVARPLDSHEYTCQEHEDGREDHHHRVDGNWMLCRCHVISIEPCKIGFKRRKTRRQLVDVCTNFIARLDKTSTVRVDNLTYGFVVLNTFDLDSTYVLTGSINMELMADS